jgi:hypothetical protein
MLQAYDTFCQIKSKLMQTRHSSPRSRIARIEDETGKVTEWRSKALPRYQRLTKKADTKAR